MKKFTQVLMVLATGLTLTACQSSVTKLQGQSHHYTDQQKCPTLLVMKVGETLEFNAPENPTTGYRWQILKPLNLFKVEEAYKATPTEQPMMGSGGHKTIKFTAKQAGQEQIELAYIQPWLLEKKQINLSQEKIWQCRIRIS